jgi:hypothetical protein
MEDNIIENIKKEMWDLWLSKIKEAGKSDAEAEEILDKEIWLKTLQECSKPCKCAEIKGLCGQKIKDWCANYKKSCKSKSNPQN